jgi:hypothetical protein
MCTMMYLFPTLIDFLFSCQISKIMLTNQSAVLANIIFRYTVRKMGLILRSIERMLTMQFSMARKFTLQPLRDMT